MGNPFPSDDRTCAIYGVDTVPDPRTLVDIFRETVHHYPNATALIGTNESLTYSQLAERIDDQVERLAQLGIGRGARIGIRVPSGTTDLYIAILATICAERPTYLLTGTTRTLVQTPSGKKPMPPQSMVQSFPSTSEATISLRLLLASPQQQMMHGSSSLPDLQVSPRV